MDEPRHTARTLRNNGRAAPEPLADAVTPNGAMTLENINTARVQDAIETLTDAEKKSLDELARKLRTFAAGDVLAEMEYHDGELARWGAWLQDETLDAESNELAAYCVTDHRRMREVCARELSRRNHQDKLPSGGARTAITRELIDEIKTRADLPDLIQARGMDLKKRGRRWVACCPFHEDKTPSMSVDADKGLWHCFGCNAGGDSIGFVMQYDRVDFIPALRILADRAGVEIPDPTPRILKRETSYYLPVDAILGALQRAETGDAELLACLFVDRIAYDHAESSWHLFHRHTWERDATGKVEKFVTDELAAQYIFAAAETKRRESEGETVEKRIRELIGRASALRYRNKIANVLDRARKQDALALGGDEWDKDALLLGCANGILNLRSQDFELRDGAPRDYIRTAAPTAWQDLDAPAPRWERFLQEIFAGDADLIAFVQRLLGYAITGQTVEHVLPVLWGEGRNGKDTLLETIKFVLGKYAAPVQAEVLLSTERNPNAATPHLYAFRGRRLVWVSETNEGARLNAGQVKLLTGGGTIVARPLYGKPVEFEPHYLLMLITNHKPHASADDYALWSRLLLIPFTQAFITEPIAENEHPRDANLLAKLRSEAPGILAWLVRGCLEWQRDGLNPPDTVRLATEEYREGEDSIAQYITDRLVIASHAEVKANDVYSDYAMWAKEGGSAPMSGTAFGMRMGKRFKKERRASGVFYLGVGLRANDPTGPAAPNRRSLLDALEREERLGRLERR